jgi:hypothetical protein
MQGQGTHQVSQLATAACLRLTDSHRTKEPKPVKRSTYGQGRPQGLQVQKRLDILEGLEDNGDYVPEDQARLVGVRPDSSNHRSVRSSCLVHQGDSFNEEEVSKTLQSTRPTHYRPLKRAQLTADPAKQAKFNARPLKRGSNREDAPIRKGAKTIKKLLQPEPKPDPLSRYRHLLNYDKSDRVVCLPVLYHDPQARTKLAFNAWQLLRLYDLSL